MASVSTHIVLLISLLPTVFGWPDGAPCVHAAYESMNPLEAVEHQGGLQVGWFSFPLDFLQAIPLKRLS